MIICESEMEQLSCCEIRLHRSKSPPANIEARTSVPRGRHEDLNSLTFQNRIAAIASMKLYEHIH